MSFNTTQVCSRLLGVTLCALQARGCRFPGRLEICQTLSCPRKAQTSPLSKEWILLRFPSNCSQRQAEGYELREWSPRAGIPPSKRKAANLSRVSWRLAFYRLKFAIWTLPCVVWFDLEARGDILAACVPIFLLPNSRSPCPPYKWLSDPEALEHFSWLKGTEN